MLTAALWIAGARSRGARAIPPARSADRPDEERAASRHWLDVARRVMKRVSHERVILVAAGVTFYSLLALFPGIAALVSLYGLAADPATIARQVDNLAFLLPGGAIQVIYEEIARIAAQPAARLGFTFLVSIAISLWSANGGVKALFEALDVVYRVDETRSFVRFTATSLAFVLGGIALTIIAIAGVVAVPIALRYIGLPAFGKSLISIARWPILYAVVAAAIAVVYRFGPDRKHPHWRWITWGSALAAFAWIAASVAFSWYTENFGSYNKTYGSLGAVIGFMTWIWLSSIIFLVGAEVDSVLERHTRKAQARQHHDAPTARNVVAGTSSA